MKMENRPSNKSGIMMRPSFNEKTIANKYSFKTIESQNVLSNTKNYLRKYYTPNKDCWKRYLFARLPLINWLKGYSVKDNLLKDVIGGLTIGVVQIPQSMAYSLMADLPPVNGLYTSFFSVLMYFIFGTSRHLSLGTYGIVSLMVASAVEKFEGKLYPGDTNSHNDSHNNLMHLNTTTNAGASSSSQSYLSNNPDQAKVLIASVIAFFVGLLQIFFGLIHAGVVTKYLSDIIVAGFTTGAAYHIVVSQINTLLGISVKHEYSFFKLIEYFIEIFGNIKKINYPTIIVSVVSMFELYMVKHYINQKYKDKMIAPFPIELVIVVFGTLFSYLFRFHENFKISIVGNIPLGIPAPSIPPLWLFNQLIPEIIEIAIVSFALNISMAKLFAKRYKYTIRPNQELFAYGIGNFLSSLFKGFPTCVGLSRCVILEGTGAKTLLHSAITSSVVLVVIVGIGFLFRTLPTACLSSIIVIALIPMLLEVKQILPIWRRSKIEAIAWLATFLGVMILDVDFGLYIGIALSLLLFIFENQRARTFVMGNIPETDIYEAIAECEDAREIDSIKIIRYESSIFYANVENFNYKILKKAGVNANEIIEKINKKKAEYLKKMNKINSKIKKKDKSKSAKAKNQTTQVSSESNNSSIQDISETSELQAVQNELDSEIAKILQSIEIKDLIIDFSCVNLIDTMGVEAVVTLIDIYKQLGIQTHLSYCKRYIIRAFNKSPLKDKINYDFIYPTTHDAVLSILNSRDNEYYSSEPVSSASDLGSFSIEIEKGKYEKLDKEERSGLGPKIYLKKKDDYDIFNEIVSDI